jgi:hypothetical protein
MGKSDPINKACKERMTAGNILQVLNNADTYKPHPRTFTLKLVANYELRENKENTYMVRKRLKELNSNQSPKRSRRTRSPR